MVSLNSVGDLTLDGDVAVLTISSPPVNALSAEVRAALLEGVTRAEADPAVAALVVICAGRTFIAGADISEFGKPPRAPALPEVIAALESAKKPVVAAIHGTALGGGFEVALAAHARVAVPSAKVGLPEIKLGLIPGAGGTQRLPRLIGVEKALDLILSGTPISADKAMTLGAVDAVVAEADLRSGAVAHARALAASGTRPVPARARDEHLAAARADAGLFGRIRKAHARKNRGFQAWARAIESVENGLTMPFDAAQTAERAIFMELMAGTQSKAQRHVFFAERQVTKIPDVSADTPVLPIDTVGVIGAGTMGGGIAMNFLEAGIPVTIVETNAAALERGVGVIRKNYERTAAKGRMTQAEVEARMALLTPTLDFAALGSADLVIEAAFETMAVKRDIFGKLDAVAQPGAILASNTSSLDLDEIAAVTSRPEQVIGLHFFSPANIMRLLEVVRGAMTATPVIATAMALAKRIGKTAVLVGVCHGFVGNRMLAERRREADKLILEGALPWDVDRVLYDFGLPMGPFAMADLAGLDLGWSKETTSSSTVREILNERDRRGQKTGAGFYDYDAERKATPSAEVEKIILDFAASKGITRRPVTDAEILERCLYPMVNEGAEILAEGIALRASDIDVVWIAGYGWPVFTGGPMFWAETVGLAKIVERLKAYEAVHGPDFTPAPLLERLAAEGKGFADA